MEAGTGTTVKPESKNIAVLMWIGSIFLGFIPGLVVYLTKQDDSYAFGQSKEALNWFITFVVGYLVAFTLTFILIGILGYFILPALHAIFCIWGAVSTSTGKEFKVPFAIRLIS